MKRVFRVDDPDETRHIRDESLASLYLTSNKKGMLFNRLSTEERDAMGRDIPGGLVIWNTTVNALQVFAPRAGEWETLLTKDLILPTGGHDGQILTIVDGELEWNDVVYPPLQNIPSPFPLDGWADGKVLTIEKGQLAWANIGLGRPISTASPGQVLCQGYNGDFDGLLGGMEGSTLTTRGGRVTWEMPFPDPLRNAGDMIIRNAYGGSTNLSIGLTGQVLTVDRGMLPAWKTLSHVPDVCKLIGDMIVIDDHGVYKSLEAGEEGSLLRISNGMPTWAEFNGLINPFKAQGDIIVGNDDHEASRLPIGKEGHVLQVKDGVPVWDAIVDPLKDAGDMLIVVKNNKKENGELGLGSENDVLMISGGMPVWTHGYRDPLGLPGDLLIRNAENVTARLPAGTDGQVLVDDRGMPSWSSKIRLPQGSASEPSYTFFADEKTGAYQPGPGSYGISAYGSPVAVFTGFEGAVNFIRIVPNFEDSDPIIAAGGEENRGINVIASKLTHKTSDDKIYGITKPWVEVNEDYQAEPFDKIMVDTTKGSVIIILPKKPNLGDEVTIVDQHGTFGKNPVQIDHGNEVEKFQATDLAARLVYTGSAWKYF